MTADGWTGTYAEATARLEYLAAEYSKIEAQLGTRKPTEWVSQGEFDEYRAWRRKALGAKEFIRREREALRAWVAQQGQPTATAKPLTLRGQLAVKLESLGVDYTVDQLENLRRRIAAEMSINRHALLVLDLVEMFRDHDPCGSDCDACALLDRAEREVA